MDSTRITKISDRRVFESKQITRIKKTIAQEIVNNLLKDALEDKLSVSKALSVSSGTLTTLQSLDALRLLKLVEEGHRYFIADDFQFSAEKFDRYVVGSLSVASRERDIQDEALKLGATSSFFKHFYGLHSCHTAVRRRVLGIYASLGKTPKPDQHCVEKALVAWNCSQKEGAERFIEVSKESGMSITQLWVMFDEETGSMDFGRWLEGSGVISKARAYA